MRLATNIDLQVGLAIRRRRIELGVSQQWLARQLGMSYQQVQKYERGTNRVTSGTLWMLCEILGVELDYFFMGVSEAAGQASAPASVVVPKNLPSDRELIELVKIYRSISDRTIRLVARTMIVAFAHARRPPSNGS